jgi:8-oxo-dGTP pyrophosphatase MutT (NUDIX family)
MPNIDKSTQPRRRRPMRREVSAGGLIWRRTPGNTLEVVLVRPAGRDAWVLPKGHVERGETVPAAALREAREETGVEASLVEPLGEVAYVFSERSRKRGKTTTIFKRVHFFLMEYQGGALADHDDEIAEARWVALDEAPHLLTHENERKLLARARAILAPDAPPPTR